MKHFFKLLVPLCFFLAVFHSTGQYVELELANVGLVVNGKLLTTQQQWNNDIKLGDRLELRYTVTNFGNGASNIPIGVYFMDFDRGKNAELIEIRNTEPFRHPFVVGEFARIEVLPSNTQTGEPGKTFGRFLGFSAGGVGRYAYLIAVNTNIDFNEQGILINVSPDGVLDEFSKFQNVFILEFNVNAQDCSPEIGAVIAGEPVENDEALSFEVESVKSLTKNIMAGGKLSIRATKKIVVKPGFKCSRNGRFSATMVPFVNCSNVSSKTNGDQYTSVLAVNPINSVIPVDSTGTVKAENQGPTLSFYPNPLGKERRLGIKADSPIVKLEMYDVVGRPVYVQKIGTPKNAIQVKIPYIGEGLFILKVETVGDVITRKILITNK